jgi:polyferredoxin
MHKNKRKKSQEKKVHTKWTEILKWVFIIVIGLFVGKLGADWFNAQAFAQPHYVKPGEANLASGMPVLIGYCLSLVLMIYGGYLYARRIDCDSSENTSKPHQHKPLASDSR